MCQKRVVVGLLKEKKVLVYTVLFLNNGMTLPVGETAVVSCFARLDRHVVGKVLEVVVVIVIVVGVVDTVAVDMVVVGTVAVGTIAVNMGFVNTAVVRMVVVDTTVVCCSLTLSRVYCYD